MNASPLINAIQKNTNKTTTENGAKAFVSTLDSNLDLFFKIGASRGKDIIGAFVAALKEDQDKAIRIALWARDVRGGAGERQLYRDILKYLAISDYALATKLVAKTVEVGRWDDLLVFHGTAVQVEAFNAIKAALASGDALCAKWMPRKGEVAAALRKHLEWSPKFYRKTLVALTQVVETAMCAKEWASIDYSKLPSVASARYQKAFGRNDQARYSEYIVALEKGEAKINAGAVYPYDVVKSLRTGNARVADQQWKALPDYVGEGSFLPVVDVSGSMGVPVGGSAAVTCLDVAVSLGLYLADRNKSVFKDSFVTFSNSPTLQVLSGSLSARYSSLSRAYWEMSTNISAVFDLVLNAAVNGKVAQSDMPSAILILSDMQFDACVNGKTGYKDAKAKFKAAGYDVPNVVFWNLRASDNAPVKFDTSGTALVSGFSPAIMQSLLAGKDMTPLSMMDTVIMAERYNWQ
jgi:hypothetical protein